MAGVMSCTCGKARHGKYRPGDCAACWRNLNAHEGAQVAAPVTACRFTGPEVTITLTHTCTKRPYTAKRLRCEHPDSAKREAHATPSKFFCRRCPDSEAPANG